MAALASSDRVHRLLMVALDTDFYRQAHDDLTYAPIDPPRHYDVQGWREGRDPAPWFSTQGYLALNPDIAAADLNPFVHYLQTGQREGREIEPSERAGAYYAEMGQARITPQERAQAAEAFDARYYLAMNRDVAEGGGDPLDHFLRHGWREGRDPSHAFSVSDYLELNPDVAAKGVHPFIHYLTQGRSEGRIARADLGFRHDALVKLKPFESRLADARRWARPVELSRAEDLIAALSGAKRSGLHLTFSQDDYSRSVGGSQLCVQRESAAFAQMGRNHLHVHPANGWPMVRSGPTETPMGVLLNGESVGNFAPPAIVEALKAATPQGPSSFAIHNMLGHSSRDVVDIVRAAGLNAGFFWLHDMGSLCAGIHLLRNDVENCGAPPAGSPACGICIYGPVRAAQVREHQRLFERLDLTLAAPSAVALDMWRGGGGLAACSETVRPLATLAQSNQAPPVREGPFLFAFPGTPSMHKGWPIFNDLAARFAADPRYDFVHLATRPVAGSMARHHAVTVTAADPLAMRRAMIELCVDAAMIWSLCIETFSFAAYEAASAGAAVVTGPDSGNVAAFAAAEDHGLVLPDEKVLADWFESGEILKLARTRRGAALQDLAFSTLSAELVEN